MLIIKLKIEKAKSKNKWLAIIKVLISRSTLKREVTNMQQSIWQKAAHNFGWNTVVRKCNLMFILNLEAMVNYFLQKLHFWVQRTVNFIECSIF